MLLILSVGIGGRLLSNDSSAIIARWTGVDPAFGFRTQGAGRGVESPACSRASSCWFSWSATLRLDRAVWWCMAVLLRAAGW